MPALAHTNQRQKLAFTYDRDVGALREHFLRLSVLAALFVTGKHGQILITDNKDRDLLGHGGRHGDARSGGKFGCLTAADRQGAGEDGDVPKQRAVRSALGANMGIPAAFGFGHRQVQQGSACGALGVKDNLSRSPRVLGSVMVTKADAKLLREVGQPVAAVAEPLRPRAAGNPHAVDPMCFRLGVPDAVKRGANSAAVKAAVLDVWLRGKQRFQWVCNISEQRGLGDGVGCNAVDRDEERVKVCFGIDVGSEAVDGAGIVDRCEADLTNGITAVKLKI